MSGSRTRHQRTAQSARCLQRGEEDGWADDREDAGHRADVGTARGGILEVEGVRGWAVRPAGPGPNARLTPFDEGSYTFVGTVGFRILCQDSIVRVSQHCASFFGTGKLVCGEIDTLR